MNTIIVSITCIWSGCGLGGRMGRNTALYHPNGLQLKLHSALTQSTLSPHSAPDSPYGQQLPGRAAGGGRKRHQQPR